MNIKKVIFTALITSMFVSLLSGCAGTKSAQTTNTQEKKKLVIGVLAREKPDIDYLAEKLKTQGYEVEARVFNDNVALNLATEDGSIDANYFQNEPYLNTFNKNKGTHLVAYNPWIFTMADLFVSKKYKTLNDLPDGAKIAVANDPTNRTRELRLLADNGLIILKEGIDLPTVLDITSNPKNFNIIEIDPRSKAGAFPDLDAMVVPSITVYQMKDPAVTVKGALLKEKPDVFKKFGGIMFVVKEGNQNAIWLKKAVDVMTTKEYSDWLLKTYEGAKIPLSEAK